MIGTLEFIKCAGSLTTAECPIIEQDSDLDGYVKQVYDNVHFLEDTQQDIVMPAFDGWADCNIVRFTNKADSKVFYYWIAQAMRSSEAKGSNVYSLTFNAPLTLLKKGDRVSGIWLRSPDNFTPWKQQAIVSGTLGYTDNVVEFPTMPKSAPLTAKGMDVYWVSITATRTPAGKQGSLELYGFPCALDPNHAMKDSGGSSIYFADSTSEIGYTAFPDLSSIINGETLTMIGLTVNEITDISITRSAPFACSMTYKQVEVSEGVYYTYNIFDISGCTPVYITRSSEGVGVFPMYHITGTDSFPQAPMRAVVMSLTAKEMACGTISIRDTNGSAIATIPTSWAKTYEGGVGVLTVLHQSIADFAQCYDRVMVMDPYNQGLSANRALGIFQIPATHLPYVGDQWDTYQAYSMSYDREAMQFGIDQARNAMITNVATSVANTAVGVATGGATFAAQGAVTAAQQVGHTMGNVQAGASTGTGIVGSIVGYYQQKHAAEFNQQLTERRAQGQPGNAYNVNYGLSYLMNEVSTPNCLILSMPVGLTDSKFKEFIEDFGYANEGRATIEIDYGFYQGTLFSTYALTGPRFNELINDFNNGIRLVHPVGRQ